MINLAGRDILHGWGKFVFTGVGLGLLIGVTLTMAGVYRGMVDDARVLIENAGADLWVVQQDTLGPYAEPPACMMMWPKICWAYRAYGKPAMSPI